MALEIDWEQAALNGYSYCFCVGDDGRFCGRADFWPGHGHDHDFETLEEFLSFRRADSRWIDSKLISKCERMESRIATLEARLAEAEKDKATVVTELDWLIDIFRNAHSPTWTRDNFIKNSSNVQVRAAIRASLPYDKRSAANQESEK